MDIMHSFELASGLAINKSKTCMINAGIELDQPSICPELSELQWPKSFRLLGIEFQKSFDQSDHNYQLPLKSINGEINSWEYRLPSPLGRAGILKSNLLSKITHMPISLPSPKESFFVALEKKLHHFVWGVKSHKIKKEHRQSGTAKIRF